MENDRQMKELGIWGSFSIYIPAAILMYALTKFLIPYLSAATGQETILFWFIVAGLGVFTPLIVTGIFILKGEGFNLSKDVWQNRLRFRKLTREDIAWSIAGILIIGLLSGMIMKILEAMVGQFDHSPSFLSFDPLTKDRYWLLAVWLPYWILNILGEEFLWRGVMLPRQELAFGRSTWLIHGFGWTLFHIAFGWQLLLTMIPIIFVLSYIVQKRKNSWIGVIIHGGINGPSFLAISFGLI